MGSNEFGRDAERRRFVLLRIDGKRTMQRSGSALDFRKRTGQGAGGAGLNRDQCQPALLGPAHRQRGSSFKIVHATMSLTAQALLLIGTLEFSSAKVQSGSSRN
jgi:hypothetical protein